MKSAWVKKTGAFDYLLILVGAALLALSVNVVYEPKNMVTGGLTGLAIVVKDWTKDGWVKGGIPIWLTSAICNVPLFFMAGKVKGRAYLLKCLFATGAFILFLYLVPEVDVIGEDYLMAAVCGGAVNGAGLGLIFMASTSTGGTDLLSTILHGWIKNVRIPRILLAIDASIVLLGAWTFGLRNALYAVMAVYLTTKVMDGILEGLKFAKLVFVISEQYERIAAKIMGDMERGVTSIAVKGMYRNSDRRMLLCVVSKREVVKLVNLAAKIDGNAFLVVSDVREVMGEGFIEYKQ